MHVCSACSFRGSPDPGRLYMAGRVSICRYLKPIDGLPDPKGSLSTTIPSAAIAFANRRIDISLNLVAILHVTVQRIDVVTSHTASHRPLFRADGTISQSAYYLQCVCIIIYRVKLFSSNFFTRIFFSRKFTRRKLSELQ